MAGFSGETAVKYEEAKAGAEAGYERAKKYGLKMAWGTDTFGPLDIRSTRRTNGSPRRSTSRPMKSSSGRHSLNAELLERAGKRHPYQQGTLGVIRPGAYADIIVVDGNPLEDISLLGDPEKNLKLIMKDRRIYKNTIQ